MPQWFLLIHMASFAQFQVMGPWNDKAQCEAAKVAVERSFKYSQSGCIPYGPSGAAQAPDAR